MASFNISTFRFGIWIDGGSQKPKVGANSVDSVVMLH